MGLGLIECVELHETGVCKIPEESLNRGGNISWTSNSKSNLRAYIKQNNGADTVLVNLT